MTSFDSWLGWPAPRLPSPVERVPDERLAAAGVELWLKRDDLIHPDVPGSKWRKLKYNLTQAAASGADTLLTFGGAYSNHLRAVAAVGASYGFATIGVVRGEEHLPLNDPLSVAVRHGMRLYYLNRADYRRKTESDVIEALLSEFGPCYVLPEGGSNELAVRGCAELRPSWPPASGRNSAPAESATSRLGWPPAGRASTWSAARAAPGRRWPGSPPGSDLGNGRSASPCSRVRPS